MTDSLLASEAHEAGFGDTPWSGVFIMRGQSLEMSSFTISIDDDGQVSSTGPTLATSTHMAPYWLEAAIGHARAVSRLAHATNEAFRGGDLATQTRCLNAELSASMQAIACSAFAVDALYASLLKAQPTPATIKETWSKNRTKRSRQIFETLRRVLKMGPQPSARIKVFLDQLSNARDTAVHPPARSKLAEKHARLPVSIDPAFNLFRAQNAIVCVGMTVSLIEQVAKAETAKDPKFAKSMAPLHELVLPLSKRWARTSAGKAFEDIQRRASIAAAKA